MRLLKRFGYAEIVTVMVDKLFDILSSIIEFFLRRIGKFFHIHLALCLFEWVRRLLNLFLTCFVFHKTTAEVEKRLLLVAILYKLFGQRFCFDFLLQFF